MNLKLSTIDHLEKYVKHMKCICHSKCKTESIIKCLAQETVFDPEKSQARCFLSEVFARGRKMCKKITYLDDFSNNAPSHLLINCHFNLTDSIF